MKTILRFLPLLAALLISAPLSRAYLFQTLPVTTDFDTPGVFQMNENSAIIGVLQGSFGSIGARWSSAGALDIITSVGPAHSAWTWGLNNAGLAVGYLDKNGSTLQAFYNAPGIGSAILATPAPAGVLPNLRVINDAGYAVGVYTSGGVQTAFYTHPLGYKANLSSAKVGAGFFPIAINNDSDVLGNSSLKGVVYNLLNNTAVNVTSRVPGMVSAAALNELGDVAGIDVGSTAYIMPKPDATPIIHLGTGLVKEVRGMNDARDLLVMTTTNRPALLHPAAGFPDGQLTYLDSAVPAPWTIYYLADINNAGNICGVVRRPSTPADNTPAAFVYRAFKLTNFIIFLPFPFAE